MGYLVTGDVERYRQGAEYHRFVTLEDCIKDYPWGYTGKIRFWGSIRDPIGIIMPPKPVL